MKKNILRIILILLIILWMISVFGLSNDNAETSSGLSYKVSKFFAKTESKAREIEPFVRKLAHLSEYAVRRIFIL